VLEILMYRFVHCGFCAPMPTACHPLATLQTDFYRPKLLRGRQAACFGARNPHAPALSHDRARRRGSAALIHPPKASSFGRLAGEGWVGRFRCGALRLRLHTAYPRRRARSGANREQRIAQGFRCKYIKKGPGRGRNPGPWGWIRFGDVTESEWVRSGRESEPDALRRAHIETGHLTEKFPRDRKFIFSQRMPGPGS